MESAAPHSLTSCSSLMLTSAPLINHREIYKEYNNCEQVLYKPFPTYVFRKVHNSNKYTVLDVCQLLYIQNPNKITTLVLLTIVDYSEMVG